MRERARKIRSVLAYFSLLLNETMANCEGFDLLYISLSSPLNGNRRFAGMSLHHFNCWFTYSSAIKMEDTRSSEMLVAYSGLHGVKCNIIEKWSSIWGTQSSEGTRKQLMEYAKTSYGVCKKILKKS
jgi:hypothetical protein